MAMSTNAIDRVTITSAARAITTIKVELSFPVVVTAIVESLSSVVTAVIKANISNHYIIYKASMFHCQAMTTMY